MSKQLTYEEDFLNNYCPIQNPFTEDGPHDNFMMETYGKELNHVIHVHQSHPKKVWTLVEGDSGSEYLLNGCRRVNRLGYFITKEDCKEEHLESEFLVWEADDEENENEEDEEDERCDDELYNFESGNI